MKPLSQGTPERLAYILNRLIVAKKTKKIKAAALFLLLNTHLRKEGGVVVVLM
jgi:hypothetical protein